MQALEMEVLFFRESFLLQFLCSAEDGNNHSNAGQPAEKRTS
jgi:hypothetical protein